jgi:hypothetical protein
METWILVIFLLSRFEGGAVIHSEKFDSKELCMIAQDYYRDEKIRTRILDTGKLGDLKRGFTYDIKCFQTTGKK